MSELPGREHRIFTFAGQNKFCLMKYILPCRLSAVMLMLLACFISANSLAQASMTLEDIWASGKFYPKGISKLRSMKDGAHYTQLIRVGGNQQLIKCNYETGDTVGILFNTKEVKENFPDLRLNGYKFSSDEKFILFTGSPVQVYRRSSRVRAYLYDRERATFFAVNHGERVMSPDLSPGGSKVAYVKNNNIFYQDFYPPPGSTTSNSNLAEPGLDSGLVVQVTRDGAKNKIINGQADWVYEEEFSLVQAYEWSPDGRYIAYLRFDESQVPMYQLETYYDKPYPLEYEYKYPKSGEDPSYVSAHIYSIKEYQTRDLNISHDSDSYLPRLRWTTVANQLVIHRMNRKQNKLALVFVDATNGKSEVRYTEKDRYYINLNDDLYFLENGDFILRSSKRGYAQVYMFANDGTFKNRIIRGRYDVTDILHIDEANKQLYFQSAEESPLERHIYRIPFSGRRSSVERLSMRPGTHDAQFSSDGSFLVHTFSSATQPPVYRILRSRDTSEVRVLEDNAELKSKWESLELAEKEFFEMDGARGKDLNGWLIKPARTGLFKKYPVLVYVYGGPGSQSVRNKWSSYNDIYFHYLANEKDMVVVSVDNRGTGARGDRFEKSIYGNLGESEAQDQAEIKAFVSTLKYADPKRIGIFGWSYGGYLSSLSLMQYPEVFDCAVAVAPVTDWRFYDNIYTERYMGLPKANKEGYKESSLLTHVSKLKGDYLLVHGTYDDNVHPQNSLELIKALVEQDIPFDSEFYPNKNHGIYGGLTRLHLFKRITRFLEASLDD